MARSTEARELSERETVKFSTLSRRNQWVTARRDEFRERDADRYRLADEIAADPAFEIRDDRGYAITAPGALPAAQDVIDDANAVIDSIGHDGLMSGQVKGGFVAKGFLPPSAYQLDSPWLRFGLSPEVLAPVTRYLGILPILYTVDCWYSAPSTKPRAEPTSSQKWHLDHSDTKIVKVWLHCNDIGLDSGPLTVVPASTSTAVAERIGYDFGEGYRVADEEIEQAASGEIVPLEGPKGTGSFVDTCSCFHMGSRVVDGAPPRRMAMYKYVTPYSFGFDDHRESARYRHLASPSSSELEQLVLGAR